MRPPRDEESAQEDTEQKSTTSDPKAVTETHAVSFGSQTIAAGVAKCVMLQGHLDGLKSVLTWLSSEMKWWGKFKLRHEESLLVDSVDVTVIADIHRFEELLDRVAKSAIARGGLE